MARSFEGLKSARNDAVAAYAVFVGLMAISIFVSETWAQGTAKEAPAADFQRVVNWVLEDGTTFIVHGRVAAPQGLTTGDSDWHCKSKSFQSDDDKQKHAFFVGTDSDHFSFITLQAADRSFLIKWRVGAGWNNVETLYSDATGEKIVSSEVYRGQFEQEKIFWLSRVPIYFGGPSNPIKGKWTAADNTAWEFMEYKPGEDHGEVNQGAAVGRYNFEVPGRVRIETPSGTTVYQIHESTERFTLTDPNGTKLEFTRVK